MRNDLITVTIIWLLVLLSPSVLNAQIEQVPVMVNGMACPFCAYGVEKKLKKVEGVKSIEINIQKGIATLTAKENESIELGQVPGAIEDAGFTPDRIETVVSGTVILDRNGDLLLKIKNGENSFIIRGDPDRIRGYVDRKVRVTGETTMQREGIWIIRVEKVEEVE